MARPKGSPKTGGRKPGVPNKTTKALKDAILEAAEIAGGAGDDERPGGLVGYLASLAADKPAVFGALLGRVLPLQLTGDGGGPIRIADELAAARMRAASLRSDSEDR